MLGFGFQRNGMYIHVHCLHICISECMHLYLHIYDINIYLIYIYTYCIYINNIFPSIKVHSTLGSSISSCKLLCRFTSSLQAYVNTPVGTTLAHAQTSPSGGKTTYVWVKDLTPPTMSLGKLMYRKVEKRSGPG